MNSSFQCLMFTGLLPDSVKTMLVATAVMMKRKKVEKQGFKSYSTDEGVTGEGQVTTKFETYSVGSWMRGTKFTATVESNLGKSTVTYLVDVDSLSSLDEFELLDGWEWTKIDPRARNAKNN